MTSLGEAVVEVGADTAGFQKEVQDGVDAAFKNTTSSLNALGKKMTSAGTKLSLAVTAPLLGIGVAAVKVGSEFDQTMSVMQAATGASDAAMQALNQQAIDLGARFPVSASDAAQAMLELGKAGQSTAEIAASIPEVLALAATEGLSMADAAGIMSSTLAQFNLAADDAKVVSNALAGASNASKASVASLAEALKLAGPAASNYGLSVQETTAALAALADSGLEGGIAGTSLAGVFRRLVPQTDAAAAAMDALDIKFTDANGDFKSLAEISQILQDSIGGLNSESAKTTAISDIFGNDASVMTAVNALIREGATGINELTGASSDLTIAQQLMNARMEGTAGSIERFKGVTETAFLAIYEAAKPAIQNIIDGVAGFIQAFVNMPKGVQTAIVVFGALAAAVGPLLVIAGTLITSFGAVAGALGGITLAVAAPIAAIVAIVAAVGLLLANSEKAREVVSSTFEKIKAAVMPAISEIVGMFTGTLIPAFQKLWPVIETVGVFLLKVFGGAIVGVIKGAMDIIVGVFRVITGVVQVFTGLLTGNWSAAWEGVKSIVSGVLSAIWGIIQVFFNVGILKIFAAGFAVLKGIITAGWNGLKAMFEAGGAGILGWIQGFWAAVKQHFSSAMNAVGSVFKAGWEVLKSIVSTVFSAVKNLITTGITNWINLIKSLPTKIMSLGTSMLNAGKNLVQKFWDGITGMFANLKGFDIASKINKLFGLPRKLGSGKLSITIPAFAAGTDFYPGGLGLVGERGPELVSLPRGSKIFPANETERIMGGSGGGSVMQEGDFIYAPVFNGPSIGSERLKEMELTYRYSSRASASIAGVGRRG